MKKFLPAVFVAAGLLIGAGAAMGYVRSIAASQSAPAFHEHADFALFINGARFNFAKDTYMSNVPCTISEADGIPFAYAHADDSEAGAYVHLHDMDGNVVHVHRAGVTWADFFSSLHMTFADDRLVTDAGLEFANNETSAWRFFVNGEEVMTLADREIRELDRVLITYGRRDRSAPSLAAEMGEVTNNACFSSHTCPQRGVAAVESCGAVTPTVSDNLLRWLGVRPIDK